MINVVYIPASGLTKKRIRILFQVLERKELKHFKEEIQRTKMLRKCGRNFVKYCDEDKDNKITLAEWIECLGLNGEWCSSTRACAHYSSHLQLVLAVLLL